MQPPVRTIGRLARETGVHVETIRYYERRGLLRQPRRARGRQRHYDDDARRVVAFIRRVQALGFSLDEIAEMLALRGSTNPAQCDKARTAAAAKLRDVEAKLADLGAVRDRLERLVAACARRKADDCCPLLAAFEDEAE